MRDDRSAETPARIEEILVPQLGEGLRHARIVALLKRPGDSVERDEPIYEIETEKANVAVESPFAGTLIEWLAEAGDEVPIHSTIGRIALATAPPAAPPTVRIPPRTRAFCRQHGLKDDEIGAIPSQTGTLTEEDVLRFLEAINNSANATPSQPVFEEFPLSLRQQALNRNALRGAMTQPLPAMIRRPLSEERLTAARTRLRAAYPALTLSEFQILAFCATRAAAAHPKFRSTLIGGTTVRRYRHVTVGFAVPLPEDELTTAVIHEAETLDLPTFTRAMRTQMRLALGGEAQADETTTLLLSSLSSYGIVEAAPVLVPPSVAVLFIGAPVDISGTPQIQLTLTFDHRLINGVGAAQYLVDVEKALDELGTTT